MKQPERKIRNPYYERVMASGGVCVVTKRVVPALPCQARGCRVRTKLRQYRDRRQRCARLGVAPYCAKHGGGQVAVVAPWLLTDDRCWP